MANCTAFTPSSTIVTAVNASGSVDTSSFTGGTLVSGTYWMTAVTHYGSSYGGVTQEVLIIDAAGGTRRDAGAYGGGTVTTYYDWALSNASATVLEGTALCPGGISVTGWNYTITSNGSTLTLNSVGSSDVKVFTKQ